MSKKRVEALLAEISCATARVAGPELSPPMVLYCHVKPPVQWKQAEIEETLRVTVPPELTELWKASSEIRL